MLLFKTKNKTNEEEITPWAINFVVREESGMGGEGRG